MWKRIEKYILWDSGNTSSVMTTTSTVAKYGDFCWRQKIELLQLTGFLDGDGSPWLCGEVRRGEEHGWVEGLGMVRVFLLYSFDNLWIMFLLEQTISNIFVNCEPPSERMHLGQPKMSNQVVRHFTTEAVNLIPGLKRVDSRWEEEGPCGLASCRSLAQRIRRRRCKSGRLLKGRPFGQR